RAPVPASSSSASSSPVASAAPRVPDAQAPVVCREESTAPLPAPRGYGSLQNVRVAAAADGALVSWETLSTPAIGDSFQAGFAAFLLHRAGKPDVISTVALPARGYAAAAYTSVAPTRVGRKLDLLAYGVAGAPAFATYTAGARGWQGISV